MIIIIFTFTRWTGPGARASAWGLLLPLLWITTIIIVIIIIINTITNATITITIIIVIINHIIINHFIIIIIIIIVIIIRSLVETLVRPAGGAQRWAPAVVRAVYYRPLME